MSSTESEDLPMKTQGKVAFYKQQPGKPLSEDNVIDYARRATLSIIKDSANSQWWMSFLRSKSPVCRSRGVSKYKRAFRGWTNPLIGHWTQLQSVVKLPNLLQPQQRPTLLLKMVVFDTYNFPVLGNYSQIRQEFDRERRINCTRVAHIRRSETLISILHKVFDRVEVIFLSVVQCVYDDKSAAEAAQSHDAALLDISSDIVHPATLPLLWKLDEVERGASKELGAS
ncbi:hypothetical protein BJ165DRAFT_1407434 [Panaeolus papilionaceus]|nr:hypothetical protein BJ165DRAFT_1407434 [Panaeolus papilionaceus]